MSHKEELEEIKTYENSNEEILKEVEVKRGELYKIPKRTFIAIIDQVMSVAIALILLLAFDSLIGFAGYYITDRKQMFFIFLYNS